MQLESQAVPIPSAWPGHGDWVGPTAVSVRGTQDAHSNEETGRTTKKLKEEACKKVEHCRFTRFL